MWKHRLWALNVTGSYRVWPKFKSLIWRFYKCVESLFNSYPKFNNCPWSPLWKETNGIFCDRQPFEWHRFFQLGLSARGPVIDPQNLSCPSRVLAVSWLMKRNGPGLRERVTPDGSHLWRCSRRAGWPGHSAAGPSFRRDPRTRPRTRWHWYSSTSSLTTWLCSHTRRHYHADHWEEETGRLMGKLQIFTDR